MTMEDVLQGPVGERVLTGDDMRTVLEELDTHTLGPINRKPPSALRVIKHECGSVDWIVE